MVTGHTDTTAGAVPAGGPVGAAERLEVVDVLRGFALFGILLINITAFKSPGGPPGLGFQGGDLDRLVIQGTLLLVESKFFTLFSFLFGLGFSIQLLRAQARGDRFVPRFARRLLALLLFGVLHVALLWDGDILILYALVGFLLLLFRNASPRALLRWVAALFLVPILLIAVGLGTIELLRASSQYGVRIEAAEATLLSTLTQLRAEAVQTFGSGGYREITAQRVVDYGGTFPLLLSRVPSVLGMFLLGLYVGKLGVLRRVEAHLPLLRRVRFWGLSVGLLASLVIVVAQSRLGPISALVALLFNQALAGPILSLGYAATIVLLAQRPAWKRRLTPLAATGRMALTNYLGQSLICTTIFYGYGYGLAGQVGAAAGTLLAIGVYTFQVLWSVWWFRRFRFGPMEWLWRSLTYGQVQPLRRPAATPA
jgi:uncharacterized protein